MPGSLTFIGKETGIKIPSGPLSPGASVDLSVQWVGGMFSGNVLAPAVPDSLLQASLSANNPNWEFYSHTTSRSLTAIRLGWNYGG